MWSNLTVVNPAGRARAARRRAGVELMMHQVGRRERKRQEVRDRIRAAAISLFYERGYEATTVEKIAEHADVSKGTVFNYFPRKESLLALVAEDLVDRTQAMIGPPESWRGSVQARVRRLFLGMVQVTTEHPDLSRRLLFDCIKHPHLYTDEDPSTGKVRRMLRSVLRAGQDSGEIRRDMDLEVAARLLESVFFNVLLFWFTRCEPEADLGRELTVRLQLVFEGLLPHGERSVGRETGEAE
jgi:TetR/AcrR family transcriptional regulator, cholesterol catabolism regulator